MSDGVSSRIVYTYDGRRPLLPPSIRSAPFRWLSARDDRSAFARALRAALEGTLDRHDAGRIARDGLDAVAESYLRVPPHGYALHESDWYSVWFGGDLIGFTQPLRGIDGRTGRLRAVGVVPAFRGNEYGIDLVGFATATLLGAGVATIVCGADPSNAPFVAALERIGYAAART